MSALDLIHLADLIKQQRAVLLESWRRQVRELPSAKHLTTPALTDHIPTLLDELADAFRRLSNETIAEALVEGSPPTHGAQRLQDGFDIEEVVAEYNILRGCVHDLADINGLVLQGRPFHILNRVFDEAIALAVQRYAEERALETQRRREDYLAFVAHDLRTPLNAISLATRVLDTTSKNGKKSAEYAVLIKTLQRNVHQLEALVDKVLKENINLESESGIKLERRQLDLWPLVESLIYDLRPIADTANTQLINLAPDELTIYADAALLRRVFQNLIANAINHAPHGTVVIGAQRTAAEAVECWVRDNGSGIPPHRLGVIFEKLETDSDNDGALGLGLTIVKTFVEAHGGTVSVESQPGGGSTFAFMVPGIQADITPL